MQKTSRENKIKHKILSSLLASVILLGMAPTATQAAEIPTAIVETAQSQEYISYHSLSNTQAEQSDTSIITDDQAETEEQKSKKHFFILGGGLLALMMITYLAINRASKK